MCLKQSFITSTRSVYNVWQNKEYDVMATSNSTKWIGGAGVAIWWQFEWKAKKEVPRVSVAAALKRLQRLGMCARQCGSMRIKDAGRWSFTVRCSDVTQVIPQGWEFHRYTGCFIKNGPPYHKYFISPFSLQLLEIFSNHLTKHCKYKTLVAVTGVFSTFLTSKVVNVNQCCNFW